MPCQGTWELEMQSFGPPGLQFDDINDMPFTTAQIAEW